MAQEQGDIAFITRFGSELVRDATAERLAHSKRGVRIAHPTRIGTDLHRLFLEAISKREHREAPSYKVAC